MQERKIPELHMGWQADKSDRAYCDFHERFDGSALDDYALQMRRPTAGSPAWPSYERELKRRHIIDTGGKNGAYR